MAIVAGNATPDNEAALTIVSVQAALAARGTHLATAALAGAREFVEWGHYPRSDCVDHKHRTEFYYHAHEATRRLPGEHGHFHVFARHTDGRFCHLVGISLDNLGHATRLFTTNRWVTGEAWAPTKDMTPRLDAFIMHSSGRLAPVARWIDAMVRFYRPRIVELMHERDTWLAAAKPSQREARLNDRSVHIVNQTPIDVLTDVAGWVSPIAEQPQTKRRTT
jgi:hypothetical protein